MKLLGMTEKLSIRFKRNAIESSALGPHLFSMLYAIPSHPFVFEVLNSEITDFRLSLLIQNVFPVFFSNLSPTLLFAYSVTCSWILVWLLLIDMSSVKTDLKWVFVALQWNQVITTLVLTKFWFEWTQNFPRLKSYPFPC